MTNLELISKMITEQNETIAWNICYLQLALSQKDTSLSEEAF